MAISGNSVPATELAKNDPARAIIPMLNIKYVNKLLTTEITHCGGTLLSGEREDYIVTALHCLDKSDYKVKTKNNYSFTIKDLDVILPSNLFPETSGGIWFANLAFLYTEMFNDMKNDFEPHSNSVTNYKISDIYLPVSTATTPDLVVLKLSAPSGLPYHPVVIKLGKDNNTLVNAMVYGWANDIHGQRIDLYQSGKLRGTPADLLSTSNAILATKNYGAAGDSGSPMLVPNSFGVFTLVGLASFIGTDIKAKVDDSNYVSYVDLREYNQWLNNVISGKVPASCQINSLCKVN